MALEQVLSFLTAGAMLLSGTMHAALPDKDINGTLCLVNRTHSMSEYYKPEVRQVIAAGMHQSMRETAAAALEEMFAAAKEEGINLVVVSGYRSYTKQATIYKRKVNNTGSTAKADALVARAGTSEHQLGLAMDLGSKKSSALNSGFGKTKEGKWVYANCWRFGFIVRYLEGYESVTGYSYEPWHVRYVGRDVAKEIYDSGEPMENYMADYKIALYEFLLQKATID